MISKRWLRKRNKMKIPLDKYYTNENVAKYLISKLDLSKYSTIIEPSAGIGSFSNQIDGCVAMDINPETDNIIQQDFFEYNYSNLSGDVLTIGNPPFGNNCNLAIKFIRYACNYSKTIAFILPKTFKKNSMYDKIPLNFVLDYVEDLSVNSFFYKEEIFNVPCSFFIYEKTDALRKREIKLKPENFRFTKKDDANIAVRRVGVYAGKGYVDLEKSPQSHYFIYASNPEMFVNKLNDVIWEHNNTVGPRSISKNELIIKTQHI